METKIIDFSNGENTQSPVMVQPNFKIGNEHVSIEFKTPKGNPTFYILAGCQGVNITGKTIKNAIQEINKIPYEPVPTKVVVIKGHSPKTSSPKLLEEAGNWLITKGNKALSKNTYEIKVINIKQKRKYFSPNNSGWDRTDYPLYFRGGHDLTRTDIVKIKSILGKIEEYFNEIPIPVTAE